jgi:hypothetical protein
MEAFITSLHLDYKEFRTFAKATSMLVAGEAALFLYLKQEGVSCMMEPYSLSLWTNQVVTVNDFLEPRGYLRQELEQSHVTSLEGPVDYIPFVHYPTQRMIHVFPTTSHDLVNHICRTVYITAERTWWNPYTERLQTMYSSEVTQKQVRADPSDRLHVYRSGKLSYYEDMGFTVIGPLTKLIYSDDETWTEHYLDI